MNKLVIQVISWSNLSGSGIGLDDQGIDHELYWGNFKNAKPVSSGGDRVELNVGDLLAADMYDNGVRRMLYNIELIVA